MKSNQELQNYWPARIIALLTGAMGLVNLLSAVTPAFRDRLLIMENFSPLEVRTGSRIAAALAGFALIILASGLWRHKRTAWILTLAVLGISIVSHLVKGLDYEEALLAFLLGIVLLLFRKKFQARSDAPTLKRGLYILGLALVFTLVYGAAGFYFLDRHFSTHYNLFAASEQTIRMFTSLADPGVIATTRFGRYFANSIYVIGVSTIGYALFALLSPVFIRIPAAADDREKAEKIICKYGRTVLARFCLFPDKQYFFAPGGSVVAYVLQNRTALVLGDPIGPREDLHDAITGFRRICFQNDWICSFYQTLPDTLDEFRSQGLRGIKIGEEAIVDLAAYTLQGGAMKPIRNNVNKMTRLGWKSKISCPPHPDILLAELRKISTEWLIDRDSKEMKFSMGWFDEIYLNTTIIATVQDDSGIIMAFGNLVDEYTNREVAIDLMRHRSNSPAGTMDYLFATMLQYAKDTGYERFNLGLSGLAGVGDTPGDTIVERALGYIYDHVRTRYNFKGLHGFKEKFNPTWSPRYLIFPSSGNLAEIAVALAQAS